MPRREALSFSQLSQISKIKAASLLILVIITCQILLSTFYIHNKHGKTDLKLDKPLIRRVNYNLRSNPVVKNHICQSQEELDYEQLCYKEGYSNNTPLNHTSESFIIEEDAFCSAEIFILYFVQTAVKNRAKRDTIRRTWGRFNSGMIGVKPYKVLFVTGTVKSPKMMSDLLEESREHRDIIQADFLDSYRNLTYKHLYALKWITENCQKPSYIFKTDDDVFINVYKVQELIDTVLKDKQNFIYCEFAVARVPYRDKKKYMYAISDKDWPDFRYPTHCQGVGYLMSSDIIPKLYNCSFWRHYIWIDDLFVTGALREALNIQIIKTYYNFEIRAAIDDEKLVNKLKSPKFLDYQDEILRYVDSSLVILDAGKHRVGVNAVWKLWTVLHNWELTAKRTTAVV